MGIDEAGRGPVLGPMVYGSIIWPKNTNISELTENSIITDSKKMTEEQRDSTMEQLKEL